MRYLNIVATPHSGSTHLSLVPGGHAAAANLGEVCCIPKLLAIGESCACGCWAAIFDRLVAGPLNRESGYE